MDLSFISDFLQILFTIINSTPYFIRLLLALALILIVNKLSHNLAIAALSAGIFLSVWNGHSTIGIFKIVVERLTSPNLLFLLVIVVQIILLSSQMERTQVMRDLVNEIRAKFPLRFSIALLPAVVGLLPMPGGAIFSAPLVEAVDKDQTVPPMLKTKINYWFRHIWEYWWPLYPGVLLAVELTGLSFVSFILIQIPMTLFAVIIGYIFLLHRIPIENINSPTNAPVTDGKTRLSQLLAPIGIIVLLFIIIQILFPPIGHWNKYAPMIIGIFFAQVYLQIWRPLNRRIWQKIILSPSMLKMVLLVLAVLIYGAFIEAPLPDGSQIVTHLRQEFLQWNIPIILVIVILPFVASLTIGLAVGFVGASFPIVMTLVTGSSTPTQLMAYVVLAYSAGYAGMLLSPVHICLIVTNQHFKTSLERSLMRLFVPVSLVFALGLIYFLIFRLFA